MKYVPNQGLASLSVCHTKEGLQKIVYMHRVFPIPAYDLQGHLIPPINTTIDLKVLWLSCILNCTTGLLVEGAMIPTHTYSADMMQIWSLPSHALSHQWNINSFTELTLWSPQPRRAIANVSALPIVSYFISPTSHPSSHSGLYVFSCMISYYHIPLRTYLDFSG